MHDFVIKTKQLQPSLQECKTVKPDAKSRFRVLQIESICEKLKNPADWMMTKGVPNMNLMVTIDRFDAKKLKVRQNSLCFHLIFMND